MRILKKIISRFRKVEFINSRLKFIAGYNRLDIYHDNVKITNDLGLHSAFLLSGNWVDTSSGIWQITREKDRLSITIDWQQYPLRVIWQIDKKEEGFGLTAYLDVKQNISISKVFCGINLKDEYRNWFSQAEEGMFPQPNQTWQNVFLQDPKAKVLGLNPAGKLPGFILNISGLGDIVLQNGPEQCCCRSLKVEHDYYEQSLTPKRYRILKAEADISGEKDRFDSLRQKAIKRSLDEKQLVEDKLRLFMNNRSIQIFWDGIQLTKNSGMHSALLVGGKWFDSSRCIWNVERINAKSVFIDIDWYPLQVRQSWQILIDNQNYLQWKVKTDVLAQNIKIDSQVIGIVLKPEYEKWFGAYHSGIFDNDFNGWKHMVSDLPDGAIGLEAGSGLPSIMLKGRNQDNAGLIVQNSDADNKSRYLQASAEKKDGIAGFDFDKQISIIDGNALIKDMLRQKMDSVIMQKGICFDGLKLLADGSQLNIFRKDEKITTGIGMHTAICSQGCWYDSGKMPWQIEKVSESKMNIAVDFKPFPAKQSWQIEIKDKNTISWAVETELSEAIEIEQRKTGIILDGGYLRWFNSFEQGDFPKEFGFWHDIIRNRDGETFGVYAGGRLPAVMFDIDRDHLSLIQNTDDIVKGRALQAQILETQETKKYKAGKYSEFKGMIRIYSDNDCIRKYKLEAEPLRLETESSYIYGDDAFLHDRIAGVKEFDEKMNRLIELKTQGNNPKVTIGVSRYNFFKLNSILQFVAEKISKPIDLRSVELNIFPLKRLQRNFIEYLDDLKRIAKKIGNVEFVLADEKLFKLLTAVYTQAETDNERQLLRLLGVICEHAFIGPQIVVIDPYHRCNANCIHCWVHTPGIKHPQEFLDRKLTYDGFCKIADDLSALHTDLMIFQGDGEPLLHERFFDMVEYGRNKGIEVSFFTNGILLDKEIAKKAVDNQISEIFCSLPAGRPETFAKVNTKQDAKTFGRILENLKYLCDYKKQVKSDKPRLIMTHVIHTMNAHELVEMAENDINIGADVMRFYLVRLDDNIGFLKLKPEDIEAIKQALPKIKKMAKGKSIKLLDTTEFQLNNMGQDTGSWSKDVFLEKGCALGWNFSLIPAAGDVSFCCHLRTVGYLKDKTFKQIWTSKEYERFRYQAKFLNKHKNVKFLNGNPLFDEYCQHCDTHQVIRDVWDNFALYDLEEFLEK